MYAHIDGILSEMGPDYLVIDCGGVGYYLTVSLAAFEAAPAIGERMKVYTVLSVREDAMELFGFYSREEKKMFERLRTVTGVGARTAIAILGTLGVQGLSLALAGGDAAAIAKTPGVGKKIAQRLVLELRDKISEADLTGGGTPVRTGKAHSGAESEALEALLALGFGQSEAAAAVAMVAGKSNDPGELTGLALKAMGNKG